MSNRLSPLLTVMVNAAQKAGRALRRDFGEVENLQVLKKGPADFVTKADTKAEKIIVEELQKVRPAYGFVLEEGGVVEGSDISNRWIIDPLDGTTNFLHGIPHFAVSVALERDKRIEAAVVYNPITDDLFYSERGHGAFFRDSRLRVSGRSVIAESIFATGVPFLGIEGHDEFIEELRVIMAKSAGIRRFGAASLDLAFVAAGRYEGYWERNISSWDMAAGLLLVKEAGGIVTDFKGRDRMLETGSVIATNASLDQDFRKLLKTAAKIT